MERRTFWAQDLSLYHYLGCDSPMEEPFLVEILTDLATRCLDALQLAAVPCSRPYPSNTDYLPNVPRQKLHTYEAEPNPLFVPRTGYHKHTSSPGCQPSTANTQKARPEHPSGDRSRVSSDSEDDHWRAARKASSEKGHGRRHLQDTIPKPLPSHPYPGRPSLFCRTIITARGDGVAS
jgi:hypothetical protein